jgi:hypothetical protein
MLGGTTPQRQNVAVGGAADAIKKNRMKLTTTS